MFKRNDQKTVERVNGDKSNIIANKLALEEKRKSEEVAGNKEYKLILGEYGDYFEKFCELAYREVKALDEWGDENTDALRKLKFECIRRIAKKHYREAFEKNSYSAEQWIKDLFSVELDFDKYQISDNAPFWMKSLFNNGLPKMFEEYSKNKHSIPIADSADLNKFSGKDFEIYISNILRQGGFNVSGTPITGDQGADIIATKNGKTHILQLKRSIGSIGNNAVQEVVAAKNYYSGDVAVVVTNSVFTSSAKKLSQRNNVLLIDKKTLSTITELLD